MKQIQTLLVASMVTMICMPEALAAPPTHAKAASIPAIQVTVNGTPVNFMGAPPAEIKDAVMVPLRGVFQALGADVRYDSSAKTIHAQKGTSQVILPLGAMTATVNGQPQPLSQPAQSIGGTTLIPLRFVAQALGAYVEWHADTSTVEIKTQDPHLATLPAPPGTGPVRGQVTGVFTNTNPTQVTVRVNGRNTAIPVGAGTQFVRSEAGQPGAPVDMSQIKPGDQVRVERDANGQATTVTATFGEVRGTVKSITPVSGGMQVILNDGTTVQLVAGAPVRMSERQITLSDIMAGETVVIRTSDDNRTGYGLAVVTPNNPNPVPPGQAPR